MSMKMSMKSLVVPVVALVLSAAPAFAAEAARGEWTGYITDSHCGKGGATKDHDAACVEKCMKGGAKAQIWNDADGKAYALDGFEKVRPLMGSKVTVKGTLDPKTNTIAVESAVRASKE